MRDAELVLRARGGDELAFRRLASRHSDLIDVVVARYFLPGGDKDDLRQEALIGLSEAVRDWQPNRGRSFRSFAMLCLEREVQAAVIAARRHKRAVLTEAKSLDQRLRSNDGESGLVGSYLPAPEATTEPQALLERKQTLASLAVGLSRLSHLEREAVLGFGEGRSYNEIAEGLFGRAHDHKSIDNALQRGRRKLARALEAADALPGAA